MNQRDEHPVLVAVATTIADGLSVDWESLSAEHPEIADDLNALRVLQEMEMAKRKAGLRQPSSLAP